jgi:hypothetical protein
VAEQFLDFPQILSHLVGLNLAKPEISANSLAAYKAMISAPAAKAAAIAAGVLIVIAPITGAARAETIKIGEVSAIRAVPVSDFQPRDGMQRAFSNKTKMRGFEVCQDTAGKFNLRTQVLFDDQPHYIIAQIVAK